VQPWFWKEARPLRLGDVIMACLLEAPNLKKIANFITGIAPLLDYSIQHSWNTKRAFTSTPGFGISTRRTGKGA